MAYTNSPVTSTYKTVDMEFTATPWNRTTFGNRRDPEIRNMYYERNSNENQTRDFVLVKRPGIATGFDLQKTLATDRVNGFFTDETSGYCYWSVNNKVFSRNAAGTITQIATLTGTSTSDPNSVGFCVFLTSAGTRYLMINNGLQLWRHTIGSGASTQVTDVDYPNPTSPHMVFLDGYLFVTKRDTGDIYNSDLDNPASWTAGNYITSEINSDTNLALAKLKNYLVCFDKTGIEFFYDAANENGSPLGRNESYYQAVTLCSAPINIGDVLFFVGKKQNSVAEVYMLKDASLKAISPSWVNRELPLTVSNNDSFAVASGNFGVNGHNFFYLSLNNTILVLDVDNGFWYYWTFTNDFYYVLEAVLYIEGVLFFCINGQQSASVVSEDTYTDNGVNFTASYTTGDVTVDTFNWKSCSRFALHCDYPTLLATSTINVSWADNDGFTFTTPRTLTISSNNPYIRMCGRFRTRNWRIEYADAYPFRMWGCSMDLNVGAI